MRTICLVLVGVVVGWAASGVDWTRDAVGQDGPGLLSDGSTETLEVKLESPPSVGRFQVSAYGSPNVHGCYIVNTMTGRTWHSSEARGAIVVNQELSLKSASRIRHPAKPSKGMPAPGLNGGPDLAR